MTTKLQNLISEAVSLDREISDQTERLKEIKAQLVEAAREREDELAGTVFCRLFIPTSTFKLVENFRDEARALLAKGEANKLIKLCQTESAPRVSFETTERGAVTA
jgi:hypothetical protein